MSELIRIPEQAESGALSSDAVISNGHVFTTVIPLNEAGELAGSTIEEQTKAAIDELSRVLVAAGSSLSEILHLTIYLTDIQGDRAGFNAVYSRYFVDRLPVRCAVGVAALARPGMLVELTAVAAVA